jgi:hypothetical protein
MNTNEVERRLEALAAGSASPDLPLAILARMAELEGGGATLLPVVMDGATGFRRGRIGGSRRARGLTLLGLAAVLAVAGGTIYVAGGHPTQKPLSTSSASLNDQGQVKPLPTAPPFALGPWRQVHAFSDGWNFGSIWGGGPNAGVWLSWQNGEIVGLAERYHVNDQLNCILQSKDGTDWTCSQLPTPTGEACGPGPCPTVGGLAYSNGRWIVVGSSDFRNPRDSSAGGFDSPFTILTWTSTDGTTWSEQPGARSAPVFVGMLPDTQNITPPQLLATNDGFVMSRCANPSQPGLWTSTDGTSWQPASYAPGSQTITCPRLGGGSGAGYVAIGYCQSGVMPGHDCVAFSVDGKTWTTSDPAAGASPEVAAHLRIMPPLATYVAGQWIVDLDTAGDGGNYQASSPDGLHWRLAPASWPDLLSTPPGVNESDYHPAAYSPLGASGYWAVHNGPHAFYNSAGASPVYELKPAAASTYWSATGMHWQTVAAAPPGWPLAVVETPTSLVAIMIGDRQPGATSATETVWVSAKR